MKNFAMMSFCWGLVSLFYGCLPESTTPSLRLKNPPEGSATLAIAPLTYNFGDVYLASTPVTASFTITNTGDNHASTCSAPVLGGAHAADFAIAVDNCGTNNLLAFTGVCTIGISTTPGTLGVRTATLSRTCTKGGVVTTTVNGITVRAVQAVVGLDVSSRNFGSVPVASQSLGQTFTLTNTGSYPATGCAAPILGGANGADFAISSDTCGTANLAAGSTCSFIVTGTPLMAGVRTATVSRACTIPGTATSTVNGLTMTGMASRLTYLEQQVQGTGTITGLTGVRSVVASPDGKFIYGAGLADDAIEIFSRNLSTGLLTETTAVSSPNTLGLDGVSGLAISPDGRHLYSAATVDDTVVSFSRNLTTGALTFVASYPDNIGAVTGLNGVSDLLLSPDGRSVYAVTPTDDALTVFARTASTGALTFVASYPDGVGTVDGLDGASALAMSADGRFVYVAAATESAVSVFSRTLSTGALTFVQVHKDNIASVDGLQGAIDVTVSSDGRNVYVAGFAEDKLAVFTRNPLTGALTYLEVHTDGAGGVDGLDGVSSVKVTPDGRFVVAAGAVDTALALFARNPSTGALTYLENVVDNDGAIDGFDGVSDLFVTEDGRNTYAAGTGDNALAAFTHTLSKVGEPAYASYVVDGAASVTGLAGATAVAISSDGKNAYVTGHTDDALEVFVRDPLTGLLTWQEKHTDGLLGINGLDGARSVAISPDGLTVYVAGEDDDALAVFTRNPQTGALTFSLALTNAGIGGTGLTTPTYVLAARDGKNVYVSSHGDDSVTVFNRDLDTGALTFSAFIQDGAGGVDGLDGATYLSQSFSGNFLHAVGEVDSGLVVFTRDTDTGALTWLENHLDGVGGVSGLGGASSVADSYDNSTLYVSGASDDSLAVFTRDAVTGSLTFSTSFTDGVAGVTGLDGAWALATSRDGNRVYMTAENDHALSVFSRNLTTGALSFTKALVDASGGVGYMSGARGLVLPYDGNHAYSASFGSSAAILWDEN